uniref:Uncharacterized protein n=2 Tax=Lygus hesperus TaxID=30085 RepID=A0A146LVS7_LYGHE
MCLLLSRLVQFSPQFDTWRCSDLLDNFHRTNRRQSSSNNPPDGYEGGVATAFNLTEIHTGICCSSCGTPASVYRDLIPQCILTTFLQSGDCFVELVTKAVLIALIYNQSFRPLISALSDDPPTLVAALMVQPSTPASIHTLAQRCMYIVKNRSTLRFPNALREIRKTVFSSYSINFFHEKNELFEREVRRRSSAVHNLLDTEIPLYTCSDIHCSQREFV